MLFVLETKGTTAVAAAGQEGFLDNQKLLDQITVLVYHLMGSPETDVSLALALNTFVAVLSKGQRKSLTSVIAIRSGYVIHTIRKVEFLDNK